MDFTGMGFWKGDSIHADVKYVVYFVQLSDQPISLSAEPF